LTHAVGIPKILRKVRNNVRRRDFQQEVQFGMETSASRSTEPMHLCAISYAIPQEEVSILLACQYMKERNDKCPCQCGYIQHDERILEGSLKTTHPNITRNQMCIHWRIPYYSFCYDLLLFVLLIYG